MVQEEKKRNKLKILNQEYHKVKDRIESLTSEGAFDQLLVMRLKKQKLHLKDEISLLSSSLCDDIIA